MYAINFINAQQVIKSNKILIRATVVVKMLQLRNCYMPKQMY